MAAQSFGNASWVQIFRACWWAVRLSSRFKARSPCGSPYSARPKAENTKAVICRSSCARFAVQRSRTSGKMSNSDSSSLSRWSRKNRCSFLGLPSTFVKCFLKDSRNFLAFSIRWFCVVAIGLPNPFPFAIEQFSIDGGTVSTKADFPKSPPGRGWERFGNCGNQIEYRAARMNQHGRALRVSSEFGLAIAFDLRQLSIASFKLCKPRS